MRQAFCAFVRQGLFSLALLSPAPPLAAAPSPRLLMEVADLSGPAISPDGRLVAFRQDQASIERNAYGSAWYVQRLDGQGSAVRVADGGAPLFTTGGTPISEPPQWSADGAWIYYRGLLGGSVQVWRAAADGSRVQALSEDGADVEAFVLEPDGRRLAYRIDAPRRTIAQAEDAEYDAGIRIDARTPVGEPLYHGGLINGRRATIRMTGDWAGRDGLLADRAARWMILDLSDRTTRAATEAEGVDLAQSLPPKPIAAAAAVVMMALSPLGDRAAAVFEAGAMALRVTRAAAPAAEIACPDPACRGGAIAALAWRPTRDEVVFTTTDHDRGRAQSLRLWDVGAGTVRTLLQAPGLIGGGRGLGFNQSCAVGARLAVCVAAAADVPPHLIRVDLESGAEKTLYDPNLALEEAGAPRAQAMRWTDSAGQVFTGWYFPASQREAAEPAPLFVTYYVCDGFLRGGLGDEWPLASLAAAGVAALCINEPPVDRLHLDQLARFHSALSGVRAIIARLAQSGQVDPSRVGMGGLSFGSETTLWAAMNSNLIAAASVSSPAVTRTYYLFHSVQGSRFTPILKQEWGLGAPDETPERWKLLSPALNIDRIHTPILMQMPEQEYLEAMDYFAPLAASSTPTEMYVFPDEPHIKVQPRHKLAAYERNLDWFRFWLQDYVDPDPSKADQYRRWAAMRAWQRAARPAGAPTLKAGGGGGLAVGP